MAEQRLVALLGTRAIAARPDLPPSFVAAVERSVGAHRSRGLAMQAFVAHLRERLDARGVRSLPLKGPFLAARLHGDAGMRLTNDIDLLVDPGRIHAATDTAAALGFTLDEGEPIRANGRPDLHYVMRGPLGRLELHWRIAWYEDDFSRALLARSRDGEPEPADDLAALLLFYARDGFFGLRHAADIAAWWDRYSAGIDGPVLARHWHDYPALRRALGAAAVAAELVAGVPADLVVPARPTALRTRLAVALARPDGQGEEDQLRANVDLVDGLLAPPGGLAGFVRRQMFLDPSEIESIYELPPGRSARRAAWRVLHVPKIAARFALGAWNVRTRLPQ